MYVFYADVFILQNFLINIIVLLCGAKIRKLQKAVYVLVLVLMAFVGSILEVLLLMISPRYWIFTFFNYVLILPFMTVIGLQIRNIHSFIQCYLGCLLAVIVLGGSTTALENSFHVRQLPFLLILTIAVAIYVTIDRLLHFRKLSQKMLPVKLRNEKRVVEALALYDSGNQLREPYGGKAVHIVAAEVAQLLGITDTSKEKARVIPYQALGKTGLLIIYTIDELSILEAGMEQKITPAVIGIAQEKLMKNQSYQIILNQEVDR